MEKREDFEEILGWKDEIKSLNVLNIISSDMCLVFDNEENMEDFLGMIIMNHMHVKMEEV